MKPYPIHVDLQGKRCVVVGAGAVAERKVAALRECGADVRLVAPQATPGLRRLADEGALTWVQSAMTPRIWTARFWFSRRRTGPKSTPPWRGTRRSATCWSAGPTSLPGATSRRPPSVTRGDLVLTVSTSGNSPTLAAVLRRRLEASSARSGAR